MATPQKISELTPIVTIDGTEVIPANQAGSTGSLTVQQIVDLTEAVPGPQGVGITSIRWLSNDGNLTDTYKILFSDATFTTFNVVNGANGSSPVITFQGTVIYVDGVAGPDLKGATGPQGIQGLVGPNGYAGAKDADPVVTVTSGLNFNVAALNVMVYDNANFAGSPIALTAPYAEFTATDNTNNYLYVAYTTDGLGAPAAEFRLTTNVDLITESDTIPINTILASSGFLHLSHWDRLGDGLPNKLHRRLVKTQRYVLEDVDDNLALSVNAGVVSIAVGYVWRGARRFTLDAMTSTDPWFCYHRTNAGVWTHTYPASPFNYTQYDDPATGLTTIPNNKPVVINWVYRGVEDAKHGYYVLSDTTYKDLPTARAVTTLPIIPAEVKNHAVLVGRIFCTKDVSTPLAYEGAFENAFIGSVINDHNGLSGLNDGDYQHLTAVQLVDTEKTIAAVAATTEPTGYVNTPVEPTWNTGVLTFSGPDTIAYRGSIFTKTNYSFDANVSGNGKFFFYWESDGNGGIQTNYSANSWALDNTKVPIAIMYISPSSVDYGIEWHGCKMDVDTHARLHFVDGVAVEDGGFALTPTSSSLTVATGTLWDEDLPIVIPQKTTFSVSHWTGTLYDRTTAKTEYWCASGSTPEYNNAGTPTGLTTGYFGLYWILGTHRKATPILSLLHTAQFETVSAASAAMFHTNIREVITANTGGAQEIQPLGCLICQNVGGVNNFIEMYDLRFTTSKNRQDLNPDSEVHFDDVYIHEMTGSVIGSGHSVKTALINIDNAIASAVYYPVEVGRITAGNASITAGTITSLQTVDASIAGSVTVTEGSQAFKYRLKLTPTTQFNKIQFAGMYNGSTGSHVVTVNLVKTDGTTLVELCRWGAGGTTTLAYNVWENRTFDLPDPYTIYMQVDTPNFFEIELNHTSTGNTNHRLYIDKVALLKSSVAPSTAAAVTFSPSGTETSTTAQAALDNRPNYNALAALANAPGILKVTSATTGALVIATPGTDYALPSKSTTWFFS